MDSSIRTTKIVRRKRRPLPKPPSLRAIQARTWGLRLLIIVFAFACGPLVLWSAPGQRALPALGIGCILFLLLRRSPSWGVGLTLVYLAVLGGVRRWLVPALGWTSTDPLLLVGPGLVAAWFLNLLLIRRMPTDTRLSRALLWLLAIMFAQIFNPIQGGIGVGLAGVLFTVVPLLWYYYGRAIGSEAAQKRLLSTVVVLALLGAAYGLYQTYFGLLPVEQEWVELNKANYNALFVSEKVIRAFSFFTSSQEYVQFISIGVVALWAAFLRGKRLALLPIPLLAWAIFLSSVRGAVVITLVACMVLWAVQARTIVAWGPRLALALVMAAGGLFWSLQQVQVGGPTKQATDDRTTALVSHQVKGLLNSGDTTHHESTAIQHVNMFAYGVAEGFRMPIGRGLGSTTLAASKFTENNRQSSTEWDLSDCFAALGFAGGLVYLSVMGFVLSGVVQLWRATRSLTALTTLGILIVHIGHWLHGGSYAATMVIWFLIGGMENSLLAMRRAQAKAAQARQQAEATVRERQEVTGLEATELGASEPKVNGLKPHGFKVNGLKAHGLKVAVSEADAAQETTTAAAPDDMRLQNTPKGRWLARQKLVLKSDGKAGR